MTSEQRQFARQLRQRSPDPEDILWSLLRNRRLDGLKFRRQVPLLGCTADFICIDRKLIVEIDGRQHCWEADDDAARTEEIERHGFKVVRFGNAEVVDDRNAVIAAIRRAIGGSGEPLLPTSRRQLTSTAPNKARGTLLPHRSRLLPTSTL